MRRLLPRLAMGLLCLCVSGTAHAGTLSLTQVQNHSASAALELIPAPADGKYTSAYLQQAVTQKSNEAPFGGKVNLNRAHNGGWYLLRIRNDTKQPNWVLEFGKAPFGRQGSLNNFGVMDLTHNRVLLNATVTQKTNNPSSVALLNIAPGTTQNYAIYLTSTRSQNFDGVLYVQPLLDSSATHSDILNQIVSGFLLALAVSLVIIGLVYNPAAGLCAAAGLLFPFIYILFSTSVPLDWMAPPALLYEGLWLMAAQLFFFITILINTRSGITSLTNVALLMGQVAGAAIISALALSNIATDNSLKIFLMTFAPIVPLGASLIVVFQNNMYRTSIGRAACSATIIGVAFYILALAEKYMFTGSWQLGLLPWVGLLLQGLCYIRLLFARGEAMFAERMRLESLKLKEAEQLSRLKLSKEAADQSRLMRVIEREREVMEELREREAQRTEEMRQAKEVADEANRAKSAFLAVVSHEIRTPMTGIMGMVRLLLDSSVGGREREYAETIKDSGDSMLRLLNDILDFSKIERDSLELEEIEFDLNKSMQNLIRLLTGQAHEKGLQLTLDMDPSLPRFVRGDPARMQQVLLNLLNNAIKFTPSGAVTLRLSKAEIDQSIQADVETRYVHNIEFAVQDTGIGIDPEAQKSIFSPFAQADTSITRKFGGTGLGLAISKRLVEAMGGSIILKSAPGEGSKFSFVLRMDEGFSDQTASSVQSENNVTVPSLRILVVEDNSINQRVIKELLERMNHVITLAGNGKEGVILSQQNEYDLILMDDELPELKGAQATQIIRTRESPSQNIPIIGLTGNTSDEDVARLIGCGMNDVLAKPIDPQRLNNILAAYFGEKNEDVLPAPINEGGASSTASASIPVLNFEALDELRHVLGEESLRDLVQSLWDKSDEIIQDVQKAMQTNDADLMCRKGHEMKGMAGNFGFMALSHAGGILEKAGKTGNIGAAAYVAEAMAEQLIEAKQVFDNYLKS